MPVFWCMLITGDIVFKENGMNKKIISVAACLTVYVIFGFSFLFSKKALEFASPLSLIALRFIFAFAALNIILLAGFAKINLKGKPVWKLFLLGFIQPVIYFVCETYGIDKTSSAFAGVMLGLLPVAGLIAGAVFLHERIGVLEIICVILSVVGVILTTVGGKLETSVTGTLLLLGAVVSAACFSVVSASASRHFSAYERTYIMFLLGSVIFGAAALAENKGDVMKVFGSLKNAGFWIPLLYLSVISSVCAFMLLNFALNTVSVGTQTVISNFCTVVSVLAGVFIMHDTFTIVQFAGIGIIIVSVFAVSIKKR